ncbi:hypothetical protein AAur_1859 [Paenarthrobacter aurescens TC1]|uniref:Uncharacterized protein n=1 Tax=Paenarthrobacter aurescens (strain TC1) TaxID=290340 RepID=A1R5U6_PAEAT|nr:hypothetical protein AAur_1859 [Paenarthrobacter aurescens TC1]
MNIPGPAGQATQPAQPFRLSGTEPEPALILNPKENP